MVALSLDPATGKEARVLHSVDRNWTSNHLFGYYPLGWVSDTRCLFAIQGWQNTGPHRGKRGVAILAGDVGVEPATAEEVAFISLSQGLLNSGLMVPERGKAYLHTPKVIWEYDPATNKIRQVKGDLPNYDGLFFPRPSPDGRYYVYDLREKDAHGVYLLDTETGQQKPILPTGETMSFYPAWSPDGKYIAAYTVDRKKGSDAGAQVDQGVLWRHFDLLEGEDGPESVGDRITVVDLNGRMVQTIEVEGQKVGIFKWGPYSNAIGFLAGTIETGDGGLRQFQADSAWLVSSGDALANGATPSPLKAATIKVYAPERVIHALLWGVDSDGGGVLYNEYHEDKVLIKHARLESSKAEPEVIEGAFSDWGMEYVCRDPMVGTVENGQRSAVWAFQPHGMREVARFGPNRHTMILGCSGDVLAVANSPFWMPDMAKPGAKAEKAVVKVYRITRT
jgi:dipeptidyl aminopeptidase/acylaminoacyl peptidase